MEIESERGGGGNIPGCRLGQRFILRDIRTGVSVRHGQVSVSFKLHNLILFENIFYK
jgi:hypothetical protein